MIQCSISISKIFWTLIQIILRLILCKCYDPYLDRYRDRVLVFTIQIFFELCERIHVSITGRMTVRSSPDYYI